MSLSKAQTLSAALTCRKLRRDAARIQGELEAIAERLTEMGGAFESVLNILESEPVYTQIAGVMPCTVIRPGDMADQLLGKAVVTHGGYQPESTKCPTNPPKRK